MPDSWHGGLARGGGVLCGEVRDVAALEVGAALGLLPLLLAPERAEVEEVVRAAELLHAAGERRVGVEDAVAVAQEAADARRLHRVLAALRRLAVVVLDRRHGGVERDVEVVVEVAAVRRVPAERPAALGLVA